MMMKNSILAIVYLRVLSAELHLISGIVGWGTLYLFQDQIARINRAPLRCCSRLSVPCLSLGDLKGASIVPAPAISSPSATTPYFFPLPFGIPFSNCNLDPIRFVSEPWGIRFEGNFGGSIRIEKKIEDSIRFEVEKPRFARHYYEPLPETLQTLQMKKVQNRAFTL